MTQVEAQTANREIEIPSGSYWVGSKGHSINPYRKIQLNSFKISNTELTNAEFENFVTATNYITDAERLKNAMVFKAGLPEFRWINDSTAYWRYPNGISRGGIKDKMNHPVTTISYNDIQAYCKWAKVRLPSFEEWEVASRAGNGDDRYFWGPEKSEISGYANIWLGKNHLEPDYADGFMYTAPVASFKPNKWGLYDMYGNVFEFCQGSLPTDPAKRTIVHARGGSWWCSKNSCDFFNSVDIGNINPKASFSNQGFRVVTSL
ncbi:formylglycine-generating enzyme family protein [Pedobacter sp. MC2016-14]|uniref:SUMF1/EgtB/PvdO family nonheme iron enzyme n=1 Tax=Pedobacter sp. MC2016-14 TaxID=2897327 RepID=UPI001E302A74|nr:formylglycine-generating enzyme family protein [Pedobacter sp. MC2016-14]